MSDQLHPDFAGIDLDPGESHVTGPTEVFDLVNLIAFGGAADRATHVPTEIGRVGQVVIWESTGAADALPFWNTNYQCDVYLYLVHGCVRVEFKVTEGDRRLGHYLARTGDLLKLPRGIAHRTFSGDGKRRISLEILEHDTHRDTDVSTAPVVADHSRTAGEFRFDLEGDAVRVTWPTGSLRTPRGFFVHGLAALVAHEMHLGHNEFEGGFVVHDLGATTRLRVHDFSEDLDRTGVLSCFAGLVDRWG